ncbi:MAG: LuxR C-terminal-related transcriptional regulator [Bacteroidota bacterium]|nr:LuxR C-terminal-related transcriptional regulator [Bacteroidota bacterium]
MPHKQIGLNNIFEFSRHLLNNTPSYYEELLNNLLQTHPVVSTLRDTLNPSAYFIFSYVDLGVKYFTPNVYGRMFRMTEQEIQLNFNKMGMNFTFSRMHPADLKILTIDCFKYAEELAVDIPISLRDKVRYTNNYRLLRGDGTYGKFMNQFCVVPDQENGLPLIALGITIDITELKADNKIIFKAEFYDKLSGHQEVSKVFIPEDNPINELSERELEIAYLISKGETSEQIAEKLFISPYTVKAHKRNIFEKLNVHKSTELAGFLQ